MENLNVYDEQGNYWGIVSREEVHKKGYWHETFHCWFISREEDKEYVHFQIRCKQKKDYPNLLDISAAGHILSNESISDGIREVHEELGINVSFKELISLGVIKDEIIQKDFIDREMGNVFLYISTETFEDKYNFQLEEVSGVVKIEINSFCRLWSGINSEIQAEGVVINNYGEKEKITKVIQKEHFLPHNEAYISKVLGLIYKELRKIKNTRE